MFVEYGIRQSIDPLLAIAISYHESKHCSLYSEVKNKRYHNCFGIMAGGQGNGLQMFPSYEKAIEAEFSLLSKYMDKGLVTVQLIGNRYAPVSSHELNRSWVGAVTYKISKLTKKI